MRLTQQIGLGKFEGIYASAFRY